MLSQAHAGSLFCIMICKKNKNIKDHAIQCVDEMKLAQAFISPGDTHLQVFMPLTLFKGLS